MKGMVAILPPAFTSAHYTALFLQDNLKLTSRLTLDIGLRWEMETPRTERFNQLAYFDFNVKSPLADMVPSLPDLHGGLRFVKKDAPAQFDPDKNNFGPRIGLAFSLTPKTVIRSGYGLFYTQFVGGAVGGGGLNGFQNTTQWVGSLNGLEPLNYLSNPFPTGIPKPTGSSLGLMTNVGQALTASRDGVIERWSRVGYMQSWNSSIQREIGRGLLLEVAYVGSKGTKLYEDVGWEVNQLHPQYLSLGTALQQLVPNPFYGVFKTGALSNATVARGQLHNAVERPNILGDPKLPGGRSTSDKLAKWFSTAAFAQPAPFTFGNGPRTLPTVRTDGIKNVDFSVFKEFPWSEGKRRVELRGEFFNCFNTPRFGDPGTALGSGTFGVVSSQAISPRQVQVALKVMF